MADSRLDRGIALVDEMDADELNQLVDYIRAVFKTKRDQDAAKVRASLRIGDRVKLQGNYKPQYLTGLTGVVEEFKNTRILVKLDRGPTRKFASGKVLCTPGGLKKLDSTDAPVTSKEI